MTINKYGPQAVSADIWVELYHSASELLAHIGAVGSIEADNQLCAKVMDALYEIDHGDYRSRRELEQRAMSDDGLWSLT